MNQQQMLSAIIIGIILCISAVIVINTGGSATTGANIKAVRSDLASMAEAAQLYYKHQKKGGEGKSFKGITFKKMDNTVCDPSANADGSPSSNDLTCSNENGEYTIRDNANSSDQLLITASPAGAGGTINITVKPNEAKIGSYIKKN